MASGVSFAAAGAAHSGPDVPDGQWILDGVGRSIEAVSESTREALAACPVLAAVPGRRLS